jgi:hypothetical protein
LARGAVKVDPNLAKLWAEELFRLTFRLPSKDPNRIVFQKNALEALAEVDPARAFELFRTMDASDPSSQPFEDLPAYGARTVFSRLWNSEGPPAFDDIRQQALRLGETGTYPYAAVTPIILDLAKRGNADKGAILFTDGVASYRHGPRVRSEDGEFVTSLNAVWSAIPVKCRREAVTVAIARLTRQLKTEDRSNFVARVVTEKGAETFTSRSDELLFELLPRVRELDPAWAARLLVENDALRRASPATGKVDFAMDFMANKSVDADPTQVGSLLAEGSQTCVLSQIQTLSGTDPGAALSLIPSLTEPELRVQGLASVAVGFASRDPRRAQRLLDDATRIAQRGTGGADREELSALVAVAAAAAAVHDIHRLTVTLPAGFDLGEEMLEQDLDTHPGKSPYLAEGFDALGELTRIGIRAGMTAATMGRVLAVGNEVLRAFLMVDAAEALQEQSGHN